MHRRAHDARRTATNMPVPPNRPGLFDESEIARRVGPCVQEEPCTDTRRCNSPIRNASASRTGSATGAASNVMRPSSPSNRRPIRLQEVQSFRKCRSSGGRARCLVRSMAFSIAAERTHPIHTPFESGKAARGLRGTSTGPWPATRPPPGCGNSRTARWHGARRAFPGPPRGLRRVCGPDGTHFLSRGARSGPPPGTCAAQVSSVVARFRLNLRSDFRRLPRTRSTPVRDEGAPKA